MTDPRPPPPEPEDCLTRLRVSRYKGGTLIAEDVHDLVAHQQRLATPGGYLPAWCLKCGWSVLHVHDYPERRPRGELGLPPVIRIMRYICASPSCGATWRILPAFLPRHLWHVWPTVERVTLPAPPAPPPAPPPGAKRIPARTVGRWQGRLASSARQLVLLLAACFGTLLEVIAKRAGLESTRFELVDVHAQIAGPPPQRRLADLAAIVHRLARGIRLM
jgi:hypothetical protein